MNIGEVASRSGVHASTIRFYERTGVLSSPIRHHGRRTYHADVLHQLAIVTFAKGLGFSLDEITILVKDFPHKAKSSPLFDELARTKIEEIKGIVARASAVQSMLEEVLDCRCVSLEDCAESLMKRGIHSELADLSPLKRFGPNLGGGVEAVGDGTYRA